MINREAIVKRHNPRLNKLNYCSPFTIGNGSFAFTADITGLQSFPELYRENGIPLCTQSNWAWHSFQNSEKTKIEASLKDYQVQERSIPYLSDMESASGKWYRENPHLLELGRIGFEILNNDGSLVHLNQIEAIDQELDMWNGTLSSRFIVAGQEVQCTTSCHSDIDQIAIKLSSPLIKTNQIKISLQFPYGSKGFRIGKEEWQQETLHQTTVQSKNNQYTFHRQLDDHEHFIQIDSTPATLNEIKEHVYALTPDSNKTFECTINFSAKKNEKYESNTNITFKASQQHWNHFWYSGAAIDFSACTDPRAHELERRVILSQYLTAAQCTGDTPPQETGLTCNSWHGKFHLEMHWWHGVHFAYWNRLPFLEKTLKWYKKIIPEARVNATRQGYDGVRWPKQVAIDGIDSPSTCGPFLIWQQPHPIYYAELCYREHQNNDTLESYKEIVFETANFMATYPQWDKENIRFNLGPLMIPAQECYDAKTTFNPPFELAYWHWGLSTAQKWRKRLGLEPKPQWDHVLEYLSKPPMNGNTYETAEGQWKTKDHPSLLAAYGILPGNHIDKKVMHNTLHKVIDKWQWEHTWGWDFPMVAMCAARSGEPEIAIDYLLKKTPKNQFCNNGHNYQSHTLPLYLPGNGGLLTAVAMMAAGWDGCESNQNPGFPNNGKWDISWEGFLKKI